MFPGWTSSTSADFSNELDDAGKLLSLGIESETLKKQVFKKLAFKFLSDVRQEIKTQIAQEIEAQSGIRSERRAGPSRLGEGGVMEDTDVQSDREAGNSGVSTGATGQERAGLQDRTGGRTQAPRATGAAAERSGGREQAQPAGGGASGRGAAIRAELQRLGVAKVDLAYRAVQDGVFRTRTAGCWRAATRARCR